MNPKLKEFIIRQGRSSFGASLWFEDNDGKVYVRAGKAGNYDRTGMVTAITIANIELFPHRQRHGVLSSLMLALIELGKQHGYSQFQIENAFSEEILAFCEKHNFTKKHEPDALAASFYLNF